MLSIVATPIGNLGDMTPRAVEVLKAADAIACEDTRRTRALLTHFDVKHPAVLLSYRQGIEERAGGRLIGMLKEGRAVVLCSDGGYPGISDPGYRLLSMAVEEGIDIDVIPGASAVPVALLMSALPTSSYTFKGYPPRKPGARARFFAQEKELPHTLVLFESPMRVMQTLQSALEALGDRRAAVCSELTKKFQRVRRGFLSELLPLVSSERVRGEVTIVIAGIHPKFARSIEAGIEP